jgi:glucose-1-phosphate adenylyltransferase
MGDVICTILGGGRGTRLFPLTKERCKPAVPLGGKYRLIDIPISNCLNSGYGRILVMTQFNTASLHRHISRAYPFDALADRSIEILAAQQTLETSDWYQGTADAVRQNLRHMHFAHASHMLILSGDHLYRMNYQDLIRHHDAVSADMTLTVQPVTTEQARVCGVVKVNNDGLITAFAEKPDDADVLNEFALPEALGNDPASGEPLTHMASLGIYAFRPEVLKDLLENSEFGDFGHEVIPMAIEHRRVTAYVFTDYWADIGTVSAFYEAGLDLTSPLPRFNLYDQGWPIYTRPRYLPPAKLSDTDIRSSIVAEGAIITGSRVERSIIGVRSVVGGECIIRNAILMGSDYYDPAAPVPERGSRTALADLPLGIGTNCCIEGAIVDKNVRIDGGVTIKGRPGSGVNADEDTYCVRDGIVIVARSQVLVEGTTIEV